ncbi:hypothetical protein CR513_10264, partial [Mucuna pruriens]
MQHRLMLFFPERIEERIEERQREQNSHNSFLLLTKINIKQSNEVLHIQQSKLGNAYYHDQAANLFTKALLPDPFSKLLTKHDGSRIEKNPY